MDKINFLYVTSSSFSGSTLLAFLLNTHPRIFTISEMEGWQYGADKTFDCSCDNHLEQCPFFQHIAATFASRGLAFDYRNFGTAYRLSGSERINRYLTCGLPWLRSSHLEHLRDAYVARIPHFARLLKKSDQANNAFIEAALDYGKASVFVDATKNPFRLRYLRRIPELNLGIIHLVRDPRGVTFSTMEARNWDVKDSVELWLKDQTNILRILEEFPQAIRVHYEDLCDSTNETLTHIYRFSGLEPSSADDFRNTEHHILGNVMRLSGQREIRKSETWKSNLSNQDLTTIKVALEHFSARQPQHLLTTIISRYLSSW